MWWHNATNPWSNNKNARMKKQEKYDKIMSHGFLNHYLLRPLHFIKERLLDNQTLMVWLSNLNGLSIEAWWFDYQTMVAVTMRSWPRKWWFNHKTVMVWISNHGPMIWSSNHKGSNIKPRWFDNQTMMVRWSNHDGSIIKPRWYDNQTIICMS